MAIFDFYPNLNMPPQKSMSPYSGYLKCVFIASLFVALALSFASPAKSQSLSDFPFTTLSIESSDDSKSYTVAPLPEIALTAKIDATLKWLPASQQVLTQHIMDVFKIPQQFAVDVVTSAFKAGKIYNIDPLLILSIIQIESYFNPKAVSSVKAQGLMQVMPSAHPEKIINIGGISELNKTNVNIQVGTMILRETLTKAGGNIKSALQRYNGNLGDEDQVYANKVLKAKTQMQKAHFALLAKSI
jgi:Transglycosylase SLT domain